MREILFRGKRVDNGEWIKGFYIEANHHWHNKGVHKEWIVKNVIQNGGWCNVGSKYAVIPDTVGQYTGLTDKNGTKIFEGDIVEIVTVDAKEKRKFVVEIGECLETNEEVCCYAVYHRFFGTPITFPINHIDLTEVIGNIHDNKELLGVE